MAPNVDRTVTHSCPLRHRTSKRIRDGAFLSWEFIVMNILATVIASYGLLADSPAVVIGAMVVAILLSPITAAALGIVEGDNALVQRAGMTMLAGVVTVYLTALIIGFVHRDHVMTQQIIGRTEPTITDLMIALAGGGAGAIAMTSEQLATGLVGVAISTALVPPLASSAILIARGEIVLGLGALLLACANIVAMQFSMSIVLWLKGFRKAASKAKLKHFFFRNQFNIVLLIVIAVVLTLNLKNVADKELFEVRSRQIMQQVVTAQNGYSIDSIKVTQFHGEQPIVDAIIRGPIQITSDDVARLEARLPQAPNNRKVNLRVQFVKIITIDDDAKALYRDKDAANRQDQLNFEDEPAAQSTVR